MSLDIGGLGVVVVVVRYWNTEMCRHRQLALKKKILLLLVPGIKPTTFWSWVWCSPSELSPPPKQSETLYLPSYYIIHQSCLHSATKASCVYNKTHLLPHKVPPPPPHSLRSVTGRPTLHTGPADCFKVSVLMMSTCSSCGGLWSHPEYAAAPWKSIPTTFQLHSIQEKVMDRWWRNVLELYHPLQYKLFMCNSARTASSVQSLPKLIMLGKQRSTHTKPKTSIRNVDVRKTDPVKFSLWRLQLKHSEWHWCREWTCPAASRSCDRWPAPGLSGRTRGCEGPTATSLKAHSHSPETTKLALHIFQPTTVYYKYRGISW